MLTIGKLVEVPALGDNSLLAASLKGTDCAIIISHSGNSHTYEPLNVLRFLEPNQVPVVGITSQGTNYLRKHAAWLDGQRFSGGASRSAVETWVNGLDLTLAPAA